MKDAVTNAMIIKGAVIDKVGEGCYQLYMMGAGHTMASRENGGEMEWFCRHCGGRGGLICLIAELC